MILGNVPKKVGGDSKRNASLKQGRQVSSGKHHHTENLCVYTYQPLFTHQGQQRGRE